MISKAASAAAAGGSVTKSKIETAELVGNGSSHTGAADITNTTAIQDSDSSGSSKTGKESAAGEGVERKLREPWTQNQQTIFEWALKQYPKGTEARWDKVADHIPGKSKVTGILFSRVFN